MKKWSELKNQPITYGAYAKMCVYSGVISAAYTAVYLAYFYKDEIADKVKNLHKH